VGECLRTNVEELHVQRRPKPISSGELIRRAVGSTIKFSGVRTAKEASKQNPALQDDHCASGIITG
jgi:hypothetical protein